MNKRSNLPRLDTLPAVFHLASRPGSKQAGVQDENGSEGHCKQQKRTINTQTVNNSHIIHTCVYACLRMCMGACVHVCMCLNDTAAVPIV